MQPKTPKHQNTITGRYPEVHITIHSPGKMNLPRVRNKVTKSEIGNS